MRRRASRPVSFLGVMMVVSMAMLPLYVLAAVDLDLGAADVAGALLAQEVDDVSHLVGGAESSHGDLLLDDLLVAGRQDRGVDLAGRDRVDADTARPEVMCHLAGECRQGRLGGGIGGAGEGMHAAAGDRGD